MTLKGGHFLKSTASGPADGQAPFSPKILGRLRPEQTAIARTYHAARRRPKPRPFQTQKRAPSSCNCNITPRRRLCHQNQTARASAVAGTSWMRRSSASTAKGDQEPPQGPARHSSTARRRWSKTEHFSSTYTDEHVGGHHYVANARESRTDYIPIIHSASRLSPPLVPRY